MADGRRGAPGDGARHAGRAVVLSLTFIFVLAAVVISAGLVAYTAWNHDSKNGLFAIAFAVLSTRAVLSWVAWSNQSSAVSFQQDREGRKTADEAAP